MEKYEEKSYLGVCVGKMVLCGQPFLGTKNFWVNFLTIAVLQEQRAQVKLSIAVCDKSKIKFLYFVFYFAYNIDDTL